MEFQSLLDKLWELIGSVSNPWLLGILCVALVAIWFLSKSGEQARRLRKIETDMAEIRTVVRKLNAGEQIPEDDMNDWLDE